MEIKLQAICIRGRSIYQSTDTYGGGGATRPLSWMGCTNGSPPQRVGGGPKWWDNISEGFDWYLSADKMEEFFLQQLRTPSAGSNSPPSALSHIWVSQRAIFGFTSIFDLWSRPWGMARLLGLREVSGCPLLRKGSRAPPPTLTFWISADKRIFTIFWYACPQHILYPIHLVFIKTSKFYWNLFNKLFLVLPVFLF